MQLTSKQQLKSSTINLANIMSNRESDTEELVARASSGDKSAERPADGSTP